MSIERKWYLYKVPIFPKDIRVIVYDITTHYKDEWDSAPIIYQSVQYRADMRYYNINKEGVKQEISFVNFVRNTNSGCEVSLERVIQWTDGIRKWSIDSIYNKGIVRSGKNTDIRHVIMKVTVVDMEEPIEVLDFIQECIVSEVTSDSRFRNYALGCL